MSRRSDVVSGSLCHAVISGPELDSDVCPASNHRKQHIATMNDWPLRSYLELGALRSAVPCFRLHTKHVLWEWGLESFSDSVELIVSELTTNAITASARLNGSRYCGQWRPGVPPVRLSLYSDKERVVVEVWDGDDRIPEAQGIDLEAESGRGLLLVATLSSEWWIYRPEGSSGKCVWGMV
jgi:anti-sigma regulatory factor (Ser/Thr protein kinase)